MSTNLETTEKNVVHDLQSHHLDEARQEITGYRAENKESGRPVDNKALQQYVTQHGFPDFRLNDKGDIAFVGSQGEVSNGTHPFSAQDVAEDGIDQGQHGDCWFEASLAAVAKTPEGQKQIADMITQNADRSYTVTFPGDKDHPVTVTADDITKFGSQNSADWAKVVETAMSKKDSDSIENGGDPTKALSLLTGKNVNQDNLWQGIYNSDPTRVANSIQEALKSGNPIVASARPGWDTYGGPAVKEHEYTVDSYDPATKTIKLRNPWGSTNRPVGDTQGGITELGNGEISMSLDTFMNQFQDVSYVGQPKSMVQQAGQVVSDVTHGVVDIKETSAAVVDGIKHWLMDD